MSNKKHTPWTRTNVVNTETGDVYESIRAAALAYDLAETGLTNHLAGRADTFAGYVWEREPKND